jgi:hypothetical protein
MENQQKNWKIDIIAQRHALPKRDHIVVMGLQNSRLRQFNRVAHPGLCGKKFLPESSVKSRCMQGESKGSGMEHGKVTNT